MLFTRDWTRGVDEKGTYWFRVPTLRFGHPRSGEQFLFRDSEGTYFSDQNVVAASEKGNASKDE